MRCSVAFFQGQQLLAYRSTDEDRAHSRKLVLFIKEVLDELGLDPSSLNAVAYSAGPGSYTGLRVGLSASKGLCFSLDIPLIAVSTSQIFYLEAAEKTKADRYITLQDARRMEAYASVFDGDGRLLSGDLPTIMDEEWANGLITGGLHTVLCGTGAEKTRILFEKASNITILPSQPDARYMIGPALEAWEQKEFENILLAEPKYVKAPNITRPRPKSV